MMTSYTEIGVEDSTARKGQENQSEDEVDHVDDWCADLNGSVLSSNTDTTLTDQRDELVGGLAEPRSGHRQTPNTHRHLN